MGKIHTTLCDLKPSRIKKQDPELLEVLWPPKFLCQRCARMSARKANLCKPVRLRIPTKAEAPEDPR